MPAELLRYAVAGSVVVAACAGLVLAFGHGADDDMASEVDGAVLVELPPAEASSRPASEAADGPAQQATAAAPPLATPEPQQPPKAEDVPKPEEPKPPELAEVPPVEAPRPDAVLQPKQDEVASPPQATAPPPAPAQEERAPAGSPTPAAGEAEESDEAKPYASAHAITAWQRSLMRRLEGAKRAAGTVTHGAGTVRVAFTVDSRGVLSSERVQTSSGSAALDRAALVLIQQAAPFPPPPAGSGEKEMSFIVPIRFR